jgi:N-acyl-L-homoserine lactone synthetase
MDTSGAIGDQGRTGGTAAHGAVPSTAAHSIGMEPLASFCREVRFETGDLLRRKGVHYTDMYWIAEGSVGIHLDDNPTPRLIRDPDSPVGEIGFLRGAPATATVIARSPIRAFVLDDPTLTRIEREQPALAVRLLCHLVEVAEERTSENLTFVSTAGSYADGRSIDILLCRSPEMLEAAQRLRYEVYCEELKRNSPYADHERKTISDELDVAGHTFIAVENGETIGTIRANLPSQGPIGVLDELYGMKRSPHYPARTAICTKFIVRKSRRRSQAAIRMIGAVARYGGRHDIRECYADCVPGLLSFYKAMGFTVVGEPFFHRENGPSYPMMIDLTVHGPRLTRDFAVYHYLQLYAKAKVLRWLSRS